MREVNFSIPAANKASVGITTALYDRRALDCTSTLPLINSLNHLAYLTTSSPRIREILTIDGGIERLVCILKDGRSRDVMDTWKWNLAFQCVVNIGVRGTEDVRTRVVEADIVPVIATILDNFMQVVEKIKARQDPASNPKESSRTKRMFRADLVDSAGPSFGNRAGTERRRQAAPSPLRVPLQEATQPMTSAGARLNVAYAAPITTPTHPTVLSSPPEQSTFPTRHHHRHQPTHSRAAPASADRRHRPHGISVSTQSTESTRRRFPAQIADEDALVLPDTQMDGLSRPESPTTPTALYSRQGLNEIDDAPTDLIRRASIRHQASIAGDSDDGQNDSLPVVEDAPAPPGPEPIVGIQNDMDDHEMVDRAAMIEAVENEDRMAAPNASDNADGDRFNMVHRSLDGSIINQVTATNADVTGMATDLNAAEPSPPPVRQPWTAWNEQHMHTLASNPPAVASVPRHEDVLLSLQLLAYVSKYCNLRSYFQQSHLVPRLKIGKDIMSLDSDGTFTEPADEVDNEDEYLQPDDFNIFPLVEKFTVRDHTEEMKYWAGVVMRNLCRKDKNQGGIRQCAYYKCGRWEEWARQFAKCRRCRQTKYCSKECQKSAWVYHRHWCQSSSAEKA